jgi:predicted GNAT family N-acyltransferase
MTIEKYVESLKSNISIAKKEDAKEMMNLINDAYADAHYFKQPHFYNRISQEMDIYGYMENGYFLLWKQPENQSIRSCIYIGLPKTVQEYQGTASISLVSVLRSAQGQGLARSMLDTSIAMLTALKEEYNLDRIQLEVVNLQRHLFEIYPKWGFKETGDILTWEMIGLSRLDVNQDCHLVVMQRPL